MNRRTFTQSLAAAAAAIAAPALPAQPAPVVPPFGLSIMLWTVFKDLPFEDRLAKCVEAGYTNVQLVGEYRNWTEADFARANAARKSLGVHFDTSAGLAHGVGNPDTRDAFLADLCQALVAMQTLEIPAMICMAGNIVPGMSRELQRQCCIDTLKQAATLVEGKQIDGQPIRLLLENIDPEENPRYLLTSSAECIEVVRAVNHPQVQFLYDLFHEQIAEGNLIEKFEKHIDVIGLVHIADVPGRHQPGTGEINYPNIYRKLAQLNYRHNVAMEYYPTGDPVTSLRTAKSQLLASLAG